jgi:glucuronoarabinoxylan endo-1,4-beta-xylanase
MKRFKHLFICFFVVTSLMLYTRNDVLAATATVDTSTTYQTIEGFGASLAWWYWNLYSHPQREEIYDYLFKELGLDILRLRNIYGKGEDYNIPMLGEIVDSFYSLSENDPKVMIASWSPPASLKSNNNIVGGTLDTTASGEYVYGDFAQYWLDALDAFADAGIVPDYISIQNEPDWDESHETCRMEPTENDTSAGYDQALDSVYERFQGLDTIPKILAPEVLGIGYNQFQNYANRFNHGHADGYAYHLYHGGSDQNSDPDAFNSNLIAIASSYSAKPIFQTEYDYGGWLNTAWLMHNCLVNGNVSGYFYWTIVSSNVGSRAFAVLDGSSYTLNHTYWAFRQYSKAIHHGWKRVKVDVTDAINSLRVSAYISPEKDELSIVVLNINFVKDDSVNIIVPGFDLSGANILRTTSTEECALVAYYDGSILHLPIKSITTISTLEITPGSGGVEDNNDLVDCFLAQNYPNPFNTGTTIEYSIAEAGFVKLDIYDIPGRNIKTLVKEVMPAGKHTVNVELPDLSPGIYFYRLETGGKNIQKKMVLIR